MECNSVENDEAVVRRIHRTPNAPMKTPGGGRGRASGGCRALFRATSDASTSSDSLGLMSPLSSSHESLQSIDSPSFSPNGHLRSPTSTPQGKDRDITIHSSLFPAAKSYTPRRSLRNLNAMCDSPNIRESMAVLQDIVGHDRDETSSQISTPRSSRRPPIQESSPSSLGTPPSQKKPRNRRLSVGGVMPPSPSISVASSRLVPLSEIDFYVKKKSGPQGGVIAASPSITISSIPKPVKDDAFYGKKSVSPPIQPLSDADFYGPTKVSPLAPPKRPLIIDSLGARGRRTRRDSDASHRSFVSGNAPKRQRSTSRSTSRTRTSKKQKSMIPGVWHAIKKPKKMKMNNNKKKEKSGKPLKPSTLPSDRLNELLQYGKEPMEYSKPDKLFETGQRKRTVRDKSIAVFNAIIDPFPEPLIKRTKLPSSPAKPDRTKKFKKYSTNSNAKAKFSLGNMKYQFKPKENEIGLQTPEKRRPQVRSKKLYTPQLDPIDFNDDFDENNQTSEIVSNILQQLDGSPTPKTPPQHVKKISDGELLNILESPSTRVSFIPRTPRKVLTEITHVNTSPQRSLLSSHMSTLAIDESDRLLLGATGNMVTAASSILNDCDEFSQNMTTEENSNKVFPVFDRSNWASNALSGIPNGKKEERKKTPLVPDDQYLLDAGQNSIGIIRCKECGVMYQAGDYLDELAHQNVHNKLPELKFSGWKDERVVARYPDGRIVIVTANAHKSHQDKAKTVIGVVDEELGFSETTLNWTSDKKILLYINEEKKMVAGCLLSENCTAGYRMYPPIEGVDIDTCSRESTPCKVGISRIWTGPQFRRKGVATRLFSCLQRIYGGIPEDDIAFSIPSPSGKELAKKLIGRQDFKVYGFIDVPGLLGRSWPNNE